MAGSQASTRAPGRTWVRAAAVTVGLTIAGLIVGPAALAQVPPVPGVPGVPPLVAPPSGVPEIPAPVQDAIEEAEDTIIPILVEASMAAEPAANAAGFAIRPPCSVTGTAIVLVAIAGGSAPVPLSAGPVVFPVAVVCGAAYEDGPADPVLAQVDDAVGPQSEDAVEPVLDQVDAGLTPVRPQLSAACTGIALASGVQRYMPPPLHRFDITGAVC